MPPSTPEIILYGNEKSPNPRKVIHFLALLNLPFSSVELPRTLPRPGLAALGITYRRTPLLSIGSEMYIDTSLIIARLCEIAGCANHVEFDALGQTAFRAAAGLIPSSAPFLQDKAWVEDRSELVGRRFDADALAKGRAGALSSFVGVVNLIQRHFLVEGRRFVRGGEEPSTADLYLFWAVDWAIRGHGGARPEVGEETHPRVWAWLERVGGFVEGRKVERRVEMEEAEEVLRKGEGGEVVEHVEGNPEGIGRGARVAVTPTDTGCNHPQFGELISLNYEQVCLRNDKGLVMHFPRAGYSVVAA